MRRLLKQLIAEQPQVILTTEPAVITLKETEDYSLLMEYTRPENQNCRYAEICMAHLLKGEKYITMRNNKFYKGAINAQVDYEINYTAARKAGLIEKIEKIERKEEDIKIVKRFTGYEKTIESFEEYNKDIKPEPPKKFINFIKKDVLAGYALYDNSKKTAQCTTCKENFQITKLKRGERTICPHCGKILLAAPKGKYAYYNTYKAAMLEKHNNKVVLRYFKVINSQSSTYKEKLYVYEVRRDFFELDKEKQNSYVYEKYKMSNYYGFIPKEYEKKPRSFYQEKAYWYTKTILWKESIKALKGTKLEYAFWDNIDQKIQDDMKWHLTMYLDNYLKYPFIETLLKTNRLDIMRSALECKNIKEKITQPSKALEIPKNILRDIPEHIIYEYIPRIQKLLKNKEEITEKVKEWANEVYNFGLIDIKEKHNLNTNKVLTYLDNQRKDRPRNAILNDYLDYLNGLEKLKIEKTKNNLYPKSFYQAHDEVTEMLMRIQEKANEALYIQIKEKSKFKEMIIEGLMIRLPKDTVEIKKEGILQQNCVGTYIDRILSQNTNVIFVRKEDEPNKPYITAEIKNDRIIQARYKANKNCEEKIYDILREYVKVCNKNTTKQAA